MPRDYHFTYYFMYGTQVQNNRSIDRQFTSLRFEGQARLKGWRMEFSGPQGQPNLVEDAGAETAGLMWLVESGEWPRLDGVEAGYQAREGEVAFQGRRAPVRFYTARPCADKPAAEFVAALRKAYDVVMLPQAQIDKALGLAVK